MLTTAEGAVLSSFSPEADPALPATLSHNSFGGRIDASEVERLMKVKRLTRDALMISLLPVARSFSHAPLSRYFVGAVASGITGNLYLGANIEIPGNILGLAVHAEQAAVANAYMSDEARIEAIAVTAAPCGHCRQFLSELSLESSMRVLINNRAALKLSDLLPMAFGPSDLGFH